MKLKFIAIVSLLVASSAIAVWAGWGNLVNPPKGQDFSLQPQEARAQGVEKTIVFQDGATINNVTYTGTEDTYLYMWKPDNNYVISQPMYAGKDGARTILRYDLNALPADANITSAKLSLYFTAGGTTTGLMGLYRITRNDWVANKATWNKYDGVNAWSTVGGDYDSTLIGSWDPLVNPGWAEYDVTDIVKGYKAGTYDSRAGFLINSIGTSYSVTVVKSSEDPDPTLRPKLVIVYTSSYPKANAGLDQEVGKNALVTLDGLNSSDPNDTPKALIYKWHFLSKPVGSNLTDNNISPNNTSGINGADTPTFVTDALGDYEIELTVTNSLGLFSTDIIKVTSFYVKSGHPRIWLTTELLDKLKAKALASTTQWQALKLRADGTSGDIQDYALAYQVTGNSIYAQKAFSKMNTYLGYDISRDSGYDARFIPPAMAIGFDWCYEQLTTEQKTTYVNQFNTWRDVYINGWAWNNPADNYFYGYLVGEGLSGLATYGDNPRAKEFINHARNDRFEQLAKPFLDTMALGGDWTEGWAYGAGSMMYLNRYVQANKTATGEDLSESSSFFREVVLETLHITLPSMSHVYPSGDWARESTGAISDYAHSYMGMLSSEFISEDLGQYAKWWIDNTNEEKFSFLAWERFLWEDPNFPTKNYKFSEPLYHYAPGTGLVTARSGWGSDATWVSFKCGNKAGDHSHFDQNTFTIFKNDWLAPDVNIYSSSGINQGTAIHNSILIDDKGQRYKPYGKSVIDKTEFAQDYVYACGEASGDYNNYYNGTILESFKREFVYLRPNYVIILDRITSVNPNSTKKWLLHSKNEPTITGNESVSINGFGKLFSMVLLPEAFSIDKIQLTADMDTPNWQITIQPTQLQKSTIFLNVLQAADSSVSQMVPVQLTDEGNYYGVTIDDPNLPKNKILFSKTTSGDYQVVSSSITPRPTIILTKTADKIQASQGEEITYTITYANTGTGGATDVVISDPTPTGTTYVAGSATNSGTLTGNTLTWTVGSVLAGANGTVSFRVGVE